MAARVAARLTSNESRDPVPGEAAFGAVAFFAAFLRAATDGS